jgi:hypothetical protein
MMLLDFFQEALFHRLCDNPAGQALCNLLPHISPPVQAVFGGISIWLLTVRALRWKRYNAIHRQFQPKYETMTPEEAQKIIQLSTMYDMPLLLNYALAFALFKTYGIVSSFRSSSILTKHDSFVAFYLNIAYDHQRAVLQGNRVEALCRCMLSRQLMVKLYSYPTTQTEILICKYAFGSIYFRLLY